MLTQIYSPYFGGNQSSGSNAPVSGDGANGGSGQQRQGNTTNAQGNVNPGASTPQQPFALPAAGAPQPPEVTTQPQPQTTQQTEQSMGQGLATVQQQARQQRITLNAVIKDFRSTLDALAVDDSVRSEVENYLGLVMGEGKKTTPAIPLMKQLLRTAGDRMDNYIAQALNQPSQVVREWVDALLMQPIDFQWAEEGATSAPPQLPAPQASAKEQSPGEEPPVQSVSTQNSGATGVSESFPVSDRPGVMLEGHVAMEVPATPLEPTVTPEPMMMDESPVLPSRQGFPQPTVGMDAPQFRPQTSPSVGPSLEPSPLDNLTAGEKKAIKLAVDEAKIRMWAGDRAQAEDALKEAIALVQGKDVPELEGKLYSQLAKVHETFGVYPQALGAYHKAIHSFRTAGQPRKQMTMLYAMAQLADDQGKMVMAQDALEEVLSLSQENRDTRLTGHVYNTLGSIALRQGNPRQAVTYFLDAHSHIRRLPDEQALLPDIFSNMGAAFRQLKDYRRAVSAYRHSLNYAREQQDRTGYIQSLQSMASLYLEAKQPDRALTLLQKVDALAQQWNLSVAS